MSMPFKGLSFGLGFAATLLSCLISRPALSETTPPDFKVAFIGDLGVGSKSKKVLRLIRDEKAQLILHQGDFDYRNNPAAWETMVDSILGSDFPYIASAGNHDAQDWFPANGFRDRLNQRAARVAGMSCTGDHGVNGVCVYKGMMFVTSGVGSIGRSNLTYLQGVLQQSDPFVWKVCSWHKQQKSYQVGGKSTAVPWDFYRACREHGAIIAQGHEHNYSRTYTMSHFEQFQVHHRSNDLVVGAGLSFAFTQGLGGESLRGQDLCLRKGECPYWASIYTSTQNAEPSVLFCSFHVDGQENKARCYLKNIKNAIIDDFTITSENGPFAPSAKKIAKKLERPTTLSFPTEMSTMDDLWITKEDLKECE